MSKKAYDTLVNADTSRVGAVSMRLLDRLQTLEGVQPGEQVASLALCFLAYCQAAKVDPQDAFAMSKNMVARSRHAQAEFKTIEDFIKHEVVGSR